MWSRDQIVPLRFRDETKTVIFLVSHPYSRIMYLFSPFLVILLLPTLPKHSFAAISSSAAVFKTHRYTQSWAQIITAVILVLDEVRLRNRSSVETNLVFWPLSEPNLMKIEIKVSEPLWNPHINKYLQLNRVERLCRQHFVGSFWNKFINPRSIGLCACSV